MTRLGLLGTRLWWRRGSSAAILAVALTATVTAVVAPIYADAAAESTLRQVLTDAPPDASGLHVQTQTDVTVDPISPMTQVLPAGFNRAYPTIIPTLQVATRAQATSTSFVPPVVTAIVWRPGTCEHVHLVAGRCPHGPTEVMVSARTLGPTWAMRIGATIVVPGLPQDMVSPDSGGIPVPSPGTLHIVGAYTPNNVDDPFWFGHDYFDAHLGSGPSGDGPDTVDDMFVDRPAIDQASAGTTGIAWVDYPLSPKAIRLATVPALRRAVAIAQHAFPLTGQPTMTTGIDSVLDQAKRARSGLDSGTALVTLQLLLLAWLVLFHVVAASAESRGPEIAVAKLRGLRPRDAAIFALGEPVALVAVAAPVGVALGWLATRWLAASALADGIDVHVGVAAWLAAAAAVAGGLVATVFATRRTLARPILDQWRRADEHVSRGRHTLVIDAIALGVAIAGIAGLARQGALSRSTKVEPSVLSLVGPALLVLAAALVGIRLLPVIGRMAAAASRGTRHLGVFLAVRQIARRATEHRFAVLLAVASGIAVFSVAANDVVSHNELRRARAEVGTNAVVTVEPQAGVDVLAAVDKADPHGEWAMAASEWTPEGGSVGVPIQAVDVSRLQRLGYLDGTSVAADLPQLTVHHAHSIRIATTALRITMSATGMLGHPTLDVTVVDSRGRTLFVPGPVVRVGRHTVAASLPCASGCRLVGLDLDRDISNTSTMSGSFTISGIEQQTAGSWLTVDAQLTTPQAWRAGRKQTSGNDIVGATANGVTDVFIAMPGGWPSIELADLPRPLPVILTTNATVTPQTDPFVIDPVGRDVEMHRVATVSLVPRLLSTGGLADFAAARDALPAFDRYGRYQVWLGKAAPRDALQRLRAVGLIPGRPDTVAHRLAALRQQGPALALRLFMFASFACSALALAAAALAFAAAGRRRSFEMAALLAVGVRRASLLRACVSEQIVLLGTGLVLGVVPGLIGAAVALPAVPEFADHSPISLDFVPSTTTVGSFVIALTLVVLTVAVVGGAALLRSAVPSRLREAAP